MGILTDIQDAWSHPQMRHAMLVHWPIVLSILALVFTLLLLINRGKSMTLRVIALAVCLGVMVTGYMTMQSGELAEDNQRIDDPQAQAALEEHEELGEKVPLLGAICTGLIAISFIPKGIVRVGAAALGFVACTGTACWIASTAHHGGLLVYQYGVGTPRLGGPSPATLPASMTPADSSSAAASSPEPSSGDPRVAFFREQVQPILAQRCQLCHNTKRVADKKSGLLDQTTLESMLRGGRSGPAIVPGKAEESLLIARITAEDENDRMPPPPKDPLTPAQIEVLRQWIRDGANWK